MDLSVLASVLKPISGVLGGALLGPAGAAVAPLIVGTLATALGLDEGASPDAVAEEIRANPVGPAIVSEAERNIGKTVQEIEASVMEMTQRTYGEELKQENKFVKYARPFSIWTIGIVTMGYGLCIVAATCKAVFYGDAAALTLLVSNAGVLGVALAPCGAVAGIASWGRTKEKMSGTSNALTAVTSLIPTLSKSR